jgi:hypothetical protein
MLYGKFIHPQAQPGNKEATPIGRTKVDIPCSQLNSQPRTAELDHLHLPDIMVAESGGCMVVFSEELVEFIRIILYPPM